MTGISTRIAACAFLAAGLLSAPLTDRSDADAPRSVSDAVHAGFPLTLPNPEFDKRRAEFFIEEEAYVEAQRRLLRASRYAPSDPEIHRRLGFVYMKLEKPKKAADSYRRAVDLMPSDFESWKGLGEAQLAAGDGAAAQASLASLKSLCGGCAEAVELETTLASGSYSP
jgi:predicted Zn-dependent protease